MGSVPVTVLVVDDDALARAFEEAGGGIGAIAAEILGIDGVVKNCW